MRRTNLCALAIGLGATLLSSACKVHVNDAPIDTSEECAAYCDRAIACGDDLDAEECRDQCNGAMDRCLNSQKSDARDRLDECSDEECGDVFECSVDVGAECYFAID